MSRILNFVLFMFCTANNGRGPLHKSSQVHKTPRVFEIYFYRDVKMWVDSNRGSCHNNNTETAEILWNVLIFFWFCLLQSNIFSTATCCFAKNNYLSIIQYYPGKRLARRSARNTCTSSPMSVCMCAENVWRDRLAKGPPAVTVVFAERIGMV